MKFLNLFFFYLLIQNSVPVFITSGTYSSLSLYPISIPDNAVIINRKLKQRSPSLKNKIKQNSKKRSLMRKELKMATLPIKQITLPKLLSLIKVSDPKFYAKMAPLSKDNKIRYLQECAGSEFFGTNANLLYALGGVVGVKLIMDRIIQSRKLSSLKQLVHFKARILIESRIQKRREISELENSIISLEDKLENLTEGTGSKVTELNGWVDSHRF